MKKIYLTILISLFNTIVYCQLPIYPPAYNDKYDPNETETSVLNTGNDMLLGDNQGFEEQVTVCDGTEPHFMWWDMYTSGDQWTMPIYEYSEEINGSIIDPDVVLFESYNTTTAAYDYYAMIVYQTQDDEIYYLVKQYDLSGTPTWISQPPYYLGKGFNPNIDASVPETSIYGSNKFAITWEVDGKIMGFVGDFANGGILNPSGGIIIYDPNQSNADGDGKTPDVTISFTSFVSPEYVVSFAFNTSDNHLNVHQEDYVDIYNNNIDINNKHLLYEYPYTYGRPRIASPDIAQGGAAYDANDYEIVVDAYDISNSYIQILGFNKYQSSNSNYDYNYDVNWWQGLPVVCYSGDQIFVSWALEEPTSVDVNITQIVLACDGSFNNNYYSQVNMYDDGTQSIPSISAQYTGYIFYSWMDFETDHIKTKTSYSANVYLKRKDTDILNLYPNPATENFTIFSNGPGTLQLIDITGKEVMNNTLKEFKNLIDISGIAPGVYNIKTITKHSVDVQKLIIY